MSFKPDFKVRFHLEDVIPGRSGGIEHFATSLLSALPDHVPIENVIIAVSAAESESWQAILPRYDEDNFTSVRQAHASPRTKALLRKLPAIWTLRSKVRKLMMQHGMVATDQPVVDYFPFHRGRIFGDRAVFTLHDMRTFDPRFADRPSQTNVTHNVRHARQIAVSWLHPYREATEQFQENQAKFQRIPFPALQHMSIDNTTQGASDYILFPATMTEHKNHLVLLKFLAQNPDFEKRVVFTGNVSTAFSSIIRDTIRRLGIADRVDVRGFVDDATLHQLIANAWALVMPSLFEAASGPVIEAMQTGTPIVCADTEIFRSQAEEASTDFIWFDPTDPDSLRPAFELLRSDWQRWRETAQNGSFWYAQLDWSTTARRYADLFARAAAP